MNLSNLLKKSLARIPKWLPILFIDKLAARRASVVVANSFFSPLLHIESFFSNRPVCMSVFSIECGLAPIPDRLWDIASMSFAFESKGVFPNLSQFLLIIPKNHIESAVTIEAKDSKDVVDMFRAAANLVKEKKLEAYRLAFNGGRYQHVSHLHMHLLAGGSVLWEKL